jgi:hypothetical protein
MADYYAWSKIKGEKSFDRGAKVTKGGLGVSDEDWKALIESGAVRAKKLPMPKDYTGSYASWLRQEIEEAIQEEEEEAAASPLTEVEDAS